MGAALTRGKMELYLNYYNSPESDYVTVFSYWNNLMGDPATECWTGFPDPMTVIHPASLPIGANMVSVSVTEGLVGSAGAQICLSKGTETYVVATTDAQGNATIPVDLTTAGNLLITVTKHNRKPYLASIPVAGASVFVGYQASTIDDDNNGTSHGNANAQINPGESIELPVQLKNFGSSPATGVTALITSTDPYVTITDPDETYGTIGAGASAWGADDFDFTVSSACPHGRTLKFLLQVSSGSNHWTSLITLSVVSADLVTGGTTLYNAGPNGLFDPGETIEMSVRLRNQGGQSAAAVTGILKSLSSWVTVVDNSGSFGNITPGGFGENTTDHFGVSADAGTFQGHLAVFSLITQFNGGAVDTTFVTLPVGTCASTDPVGPDQHGYYAFDNTDVSYPQAPAYSWVEIDPALGGDGTEIVLGDNGDQQDKSRTIDAPFTFKYYGETFSKATVCSNGWLAMGTTYLTDYRNWSIPGAGTPPNMLAVFWDELYQDSNAARLPEVRPGQPSLDHRVEPVPQRGRRVDRDLPGDPLRPGLPSDRHR